MDRANPKASTNTGILRPLLRRPGLLVFTVAVAGSAVAVKYMASRMKDNELAQKNSDSPNFYVSVDRSGGGV
ncbi:hypothetical protein QBC33DRAFT_559556 [Phialemonium atrogriseum]|uniref:Uncharacterized protein n=1 Tax=Phialemonium atrogriseum TaxID=1093897 RepID=A0AAJ0FLM6_9PEZI|nr:uncharacterized protein QBC33DRAFT_559556 [Phialemonium atrogriseum]KAK1766829.1 hypothetical protein QBC33DRAFT_559556 [Phialemonium atrogriseum]